MGREDMVESIQMRRNLATVVTAAALYAPVWSSQRHRWFETAQNLKWRENA